MTKDAKDNRRGCFIVGAIVAMLLAALTFAFLRSGDDPRSNGIAPSGSASPPATGAAAPTPPEAARQASKGRSPPYPLASAARLRQAAGLSGSRGMRHYRVNKLAKAGGEIVKRKDILADNDRQAVARVASDDDCPICDVWRDGEKIGSIT